MELLNWDIYEITSPSSLQGVMLRGRLRKFANQKCENLLVENDEAGETVRFACLIIFYKQLMETKVMNIGSKSISVENHRGTKTLPADTVVLCLGSFSNDGFTNELKQIAKHVTVVGDAISPRRVTDAVVEGALAALAI